MTLSPVENFHAAKPRPDLGSYDLNAGCPIFKGMLATEDHHCFRRSLGPGFREAFYVELEDGTIIPHRIALSPNAHRLVTINEIHIRYLGAEEGYAWFEKIEEDWHLVDYIEHFPGFSSLQNDVVQVDPEFNPEYVMGKDDEVPRLATDEERERLGLPPSKKDVLLSALAHTHELSPGETCDRCHRRVPHPKKPSSPKTKVFSVRVPLEELEPWEEALDAAASHLGLGSAPHHRFQTLNAGIALILQSPKGLLG